MKVILDGSVCFDRFGGCFTYHREIAPRLFAKGSKVTITPTPTGALDELRQVGPEVLHSLLPRGKWLPHGPLRDALSKWKQSVERLRWSLPFRSAQEPAVFQSFYYGMPANDSVAYVPMVLDMIQEKFPQWFGDAETIHKVKAACIQRADRIIAISECTRRDILELYEIAPEKVEVVYLGIDPLFYTPISEVDLREFQLEMGLPKTFLLQVGGRACHKNFDRLLEAFALYAPKENIHLVCAGSHWTAEETERIQALGVKDRVHLVPLPTSETLARLYRSAAGLVYPSLYEGFGLPPLEAMASKIPVAASQGGAIPEITQGAAALFDPTSVHSMVAAIEKIRDPIEGQRLKERGDKRCLDFSWDQIAEQTAQVHQRALRDAIEKGRFARKSGQRPDKDAKKEWGEIAMQFLFHFLTCFAGPLLANPASNPFENFLGTYQVVASVCYLNQVEYSEGCAPDRVALAESKTAPGNQKEFHLMESFPSATTPTKHRLFESKRNAQGAFIEASFSTHSPRHAAWSFVHFQAGKKEARQSIEMARTKDGIELTFTSLLKERNSLATEVRAYLLQTF